MHLGVAFAPLVPWQILWAAIAMAVLLSALLVTSRSRGEPFSTSEMSRASARGLPSRAAATSSSISPMGR